MNKELFQEWKIHPITKQFLKETKDAIQDKREESCIRDTVDQTAMQVARDEGFMEGAGAILEFVENATYRIEQGAEEDV